MDPDPLDTPNCPVCLRPMEAVDVPRPGNREDFAPVFLTPSQLEAIATDLDDHDPYGTIVRFAAWTGLRAAEIAGLRV